MKRTIIISSIWLLSVLFGGCVATTSQSIIEETVRSIQSTGNEPPILVMDFKNVSFFNSPTLGYGVSSMLQTSLVQSGKYKVVDRNNLAKIVEEQSLGETGLTSDKESKIGMLLGAEYIVCGEITEFGVKKTGTSYGLGMSQNSTSVGGGASIKTSKGTCRLVIDVRIISVKTGQVVKALSADGEAYSDNVDYGFDILTGKGIKTNLMIGSGVQGFDETIAGQSARKATIKLVNKL